MKPIRVACFVYTLFLAASAAHAQSLAGRSPQRLDATKVTEMQKFVAEAVALLGAPGAGFALVDRGKVVFEGGVGVRSFAGREPVDAHTLFMVRSNTKAMTTLLLARLVDEGKLSWDEPVVRAYPRFRLADPASTEKVLIRHLVCACTGLPRKDMIWIVGSQPTTTPRAVFDQLAQATPTSKVGELFQYSNLMAAAGGYVAGAVARPGEELGSGYDTAMRQKVFEPLGMTRTTFDMAQAQTNNFASPHGTDGTGVVRQASLAPDYVIVPYRPAGGAWSSAHDMIRFVALETTEGVMLNGRRLVSARNLLLRRQRTVALNEHADYGMGLVTDRAWGVPVIHHGGGIAGYRSDIVVLPEAGVGAVILTNSDDGALLLRPFMRRLAELVYGGEPRAMADLRSAAETMKERKASAAEGLTIPAAAEAASNLAEEYFNDELGSIYVERKEGRTTFRFGLWSSEMGTRKAADGTVSFVMIDPGVAGFAFIQTTVDGKPALRVVEGPVEYIYVARTRQE